MALALGLAWLALTLGLAGSAISAEPGLTQAEREYLDKKGVLLFVSQSGYPPFEFRDIQGVSSGMSIDLVHWMATSLGFKAAFMDADLQKAQEAVLQGKADALTSLVFSEGKGLSFDFTQPVFEAPSSIFILADRPDIKDFWDLKGKTIAIQAGDYAQEFLESRGIVFQLAQAKDLAQAADLVIAGQADALVGDEPIVLHHLYDNKLTGRMKKVGPPMYVGHYCMAIKAGNQPLLGVLNKGLDLARSTGALEQIYRKWLGVHYHTHESTLDKYGAHILAGGVGCLLLASLIWFWNLGLQRQVRLRTRELARSESTLKAILAASPLGIALVDGRRMNWRNQAMGQMLGMDESSSPLGLEVMLADQDALRQVEAAVADVLRQDKEARLETVCRRADGSAFACLLRLTSLNSHGRGAEALLMAEDVSQLNLTQKALRESEERLRLLTDNLPNVVVYQLMTNPQTGQRRFIYISGNLERLNKVKVEDALRDAGVLFDQIAPESLAALERAEAQAQAGPDTFHAELQMELGDGSRRWFEFTATPRPLPDGWILWDGVQVDVTERIQAEAALRESEERFRIISEESPLGLSLLDSQGRYEYLNPAFISMFGYDLARVPTGKDWFRLAFPEADLRRQVQEAWRADMQDFVQGEARQRTYQVVCADGARKTVLFRPIATSTGKQVVFYEDISQRLATELELRRLEEQLFQSQKLQALGVLAGGIAHDFNNVLQSISGQTQLLREAPETSPDARRRLERIEHSILRAAGMITRLMALARKVEPRREKVDMNWEAAQTANLLRHTLPRMIHLILDLEPGAKTIHADPGLIEQILMNLATNAAHAMPQGGQLTFATRSLELTSQQCQALPGLKPGPHVLLQVKDTGTGMDEETISHIFEPFFTTKPLGEGTGLGLSTVYGILVNHGGHISCASRPGQGSVFSIYLPARPEQPEPPQRPANAPDPARTGGGTVLVVDDEPLILESCREALTSVGYQVLTADCGEAALAIFQDGPQHIDLVVLDLNMPGMGGLACLRSLRALGVTAKVLVATGYADQDLAAQLSGLDAPAILDKPYSFKDLRRMVASLLEI